ncbi:FkbM family methyltransferase [Parablautia muri]|uniref:FkbM family methyltransferase n=1 Tax=Parablautia muri TaxID=2320879 RepID=A0A9X5BEC5_9FIRM|nr:FkbM family methyltransferase [Parablautia muri]NBJ92494.1 FkbM family methyltransferase [Parablautia muri]
MQKILKVVLWGVGWQLQNTLNTIIHILPANLKIVGFVDNNPSKWEGACYSPGEILKKDFDKIIIMSDDYYDEIRKDMLYWFHIDESKIERKRYLLKLLLSDKYKDTMDSEIKAILEYWKSNDISFYNHRVKEGGEKYIVQWDCMENMPYIIFEDKKMYFPSNYKFKEIDGQKVVMDLLSEQQETSPHRYIKDDIAVCSGDIIADAGVQEGNFALRYIEKVSKAYLFECDPMWIKPLKKSFEKFKDKVVLYEKALSRYYAGSIINLDSAIKGRLDFLKMDIEGAEIAALLGGEHTLKNNDVKCAICAYHKLGDEQNICEILNRYGYNPDSRKRDDEFSPHLAEFPEFY